VVLKNKIFILLLVLASGCTALNATVMNDVPAVSKGDIIFYVDYAAFKGVDEESNHVEFYLMVFGDQLKEKDDKFSINIKTNLNGASVDKMKKREWITEASINPGSETRTIAVYDQWNDKLNPGDYLLEVNIQDENTGLKGNAQFNFSIHRISTEEFASSSIEFASRIITSSGNDIFAKGNKSIIPNPSRRYGVLNPILLIYYELYNIGEDEKDSLEIYYSINSSTNETSKEFPPVRISKQHESTGITHGLSVANLRSGIYNINIVVKDKNLMHTLSRQFEVMQGDFADQKSSVSLKDSDIFESILSVIGTDEQVKNYRKLNQTGKTAFIINFWESRDPSPGTPENEYLQKIQQRFIYARNNYGWGGIKGWLTDMGRMVIKYGIPDEVLQFNSEAGYFPYQIWLYQDNREYQFVFGDIQNNGRYILLHSNREGEVSNPYWKEQVRKM
jgi:GWxTD domain-containing protein